MVQNGVNASEIRNYLIDEVIAITEPWGAAFDHKMLRSRVENPPKVTSGKKL
jgi:hypothetical protein